VRYRLMATYRGSPFEAGIGPTGGDIVLFAACPPPEELGFEPATGHWRKQLPIQDVQAVWESRPVGSFRGERCMVLDDLGDRLHIGFLGHDGYQAEQLGYWQVDRGVFELVAPRTEVTEIIEERTEYPRLREQGWSPGDLPGPRSGGYPVPGEAGYLPASAADTGSFSWQPAPGSYNPAGPGLPGPGTGLPGTGYGSPDLPLAVSPGYSAVTDSSTGIAIPAAAEAPLPLEAEAMRAASAARRPRQPAQRRTASAPAVKPSPEQGTGPAGPEPHQQSAVSPAPVPETPATGPAAPLARTLAPAPGPASPPQAGSAQGHDQVAAVQDPAGSVQTAALPAPEPLAGAPAAPLSPMAASPAPSLPSPGQAAPLPPRRAQSPGDAAPVAQASPGRAAGSREARSLQAPAQTAPTRQHRAARRRMATERLFADLASLAGIPADSYAVGEEVEGALCLVQTEDGFEVFHSADGARHELQVFATEEAACFYLFGVLAADAVRAGSLVRGPAAGPGLTLTPAVPGLGRITSARSR
jgi:hypothetical protein